MRIGVLSDSHDNVGNLVRALRLLRQEEVNTLLHCGDMTSVHTAKQMGGFDVIYVNGNVDNSPAAVNDMVWSLNPNIEIPGEVFTGTFDGVKIAMTHGHLSRKLDDLIRSRSYAFVFHGHTHRRRDDMIGRVRVINPGALGGVRYETRTACIVDLKDNDVRFIPVADY